MGNGDWELGIRNWEHIVWIHSFPLRLRLHTEWKGGGRLAPDKQADRGKVGEKKHHRSLPVIRGEKRARKSRCQMSPCPVMGVGIGKDQQHQQQQRLDGSFALHQPRRRAVQSAAQRGKLHEPSGRESGILASAKKDKGTSRSWPCSRSELLQTSERMGR